MGVTKDMFLDMRDAMQEQVNKLENGYGNVLDVLIEFKEIRSQAAELDALAKAFESEYIDDITHLSSEYPDGYNGYKIEVRGGRKTYDFSKCQEVTQKESELKSLKEYYKNAFNMRIKGTLLATEDGEEIELPELKIGKSSVVLKALR